MRISQRHSLFIRSMLILQTYKFCQVSVTRQRVQFAVIQDILTHFSCHRNTAENENKVSYGDANRSRVAFVLDPIKLSSHLV